MSKNRSRSPFFSRPRSGASVVDDLSVEELSVDDTSETGPSEVSLDAPAPSASPAPPVATGSPYITTGYAPMPQSAVVPSPRRTAPAAPVPAAPVPAAPVAAEPAVAEPVIAEQIDFPTASVELPPPTSAFVPPVSAHVPIEAPVVEPLPPIEMPEATLPFELEPLEPLPDTPPAVEPLAPRAPAAVRRPIYGAPLEEDEPVASAAPAVLPAIDLLADPLPAELPTSHVPEAPVAFVPETYVPEAVVAPAYAPVPYAPVPYVPAAYVPGADEPVAADLLAEVPTAAELIRTTADTVVRETAGTVSAIPAAVPDADETPGRSPLSYMPVIAPDRRTRRADERGSRRKRRVIAIGAVVLVVGTSAVVGAQLLTHRRPAAPVVPVAEVSKQSTALVMLASAKGDMVGGALVGYDHAARASTVVLLPAKVITSIPGHGALQLARVTEFDRSALPSATVSDMFGIRVDSSWVVDAATLATLVDRANGITVDTVDVDVHVTTGGSDVVLVAAGSHVHLTGAQAVAFASFLGADEDESARLVRFQEVFDAVIAQLPNDGHELTNRLSALGAGSVVGGNVSALGDVLTNLRTSSDANMVKSQDLPVRTIETGGDEQLYGVDNDKLRALVGAEFGTATLPSRAGGQNRVLVENGVGTPGLGEMVRNQLVAAGFDFKGSSNLPGFTYRDKPSVVLIKDAQPDSVSAGQAVAHALKLPDSAVEISTEQQTRADVIVVLGNDYKG